MGTLALLKTQQVADLADPQGVSRQFGFCRIKDFSRKNLE